MFDIGFFELILIGIVIILVIGPERMPAFARTAGKMLGRARRMVADVKQEIKTEIKADELRDIMSKQAKIPGLDEIIEIDQPIPKATKTEAPSSEIPSIKNDQSK